MKDCASLLQLHASLKNSEATTSGCTPSYHISGESEITSQDVEGANAGKKVGYEKVAPLPQPTDSSIFG
jgi:hypothetical protein